MQVVLANLRELLQQPPPATAAPANAALPQPAVPPPAATRPPAPPGSRLRWSILAVALLFFLVLGAGLWWPRPLDDVAELPAATSPAIPGETTSRPELPVVDSGSIAVEPGSGTRLYRDVPQISTSSEPFPQAQAWRWYALLAVLLLVLTLLYGFYLWRSRRIPEDPPAGFDPAAPAHFALTAIGGAAQPRLSAALLDQLADSMGYFQSDEGGRELDVRETIRATMQRGGAPALAFHKRRQLRSLLILEDDYAEAADWNPVARELATGIARRGVPVIYGRFHGTPQLFKTSDGIVHHLEDLEDERRGFLLLIFTDGKSLCNDESRFALEALARWPLLAWLDLRDLNFWHSSARLPVQHGIPIYPASAEGLLLVARRFLTEQSVTSNDYSAYARDAQGPPPEGRSSREAFAAYIEQLLGDALPWAQACAMFQPLSPGLVDALRCEFQPELPPERVERLYRLPGSQRSKVGLRFSMDVQRVLRQSFFERRSPAEQEEVLCFILARLEEARPEQAGSLEYLSWESLRERLLLEIDPDYDLSRLAQLAHTPLGPAIAASLEHYRLPANETPAGEGIPLRLKPRKAGALQRLARINERLGVAKLEAFPIALSQRILLGVLAVCSVFALGVTIWSAQQVIEPAQNWAIVGDVGELPASLNIQADAEWQYVTDGMLGDMPAQRQLEQGILHRLDLHGLVNDSDVVTPTINHSTLISVSRQDSRLDCRQTHPELDLVIERCPSHAGEAYDAIAYRTWLERWQTLRPDKPPPGGNRLSVGLEIATADQSKELQAWRDRLLWTNSVDVIYRVAPAEQNGALQHMRAELGPLARHTQLLVWNIAGAELLPEFESDFRRLVHVDERGLEQLAQWLVPQEEGRQAGTALS